MGKALPSTAKFQPEALGAQAPRSFRAGITAPEQGLLGVQAQMASLQASEHPLRDGEAAEHEDAYWHDMYKRESYYVSGRSYDQYRPAYALGWQAAFDYEDVSDFSALEADLERRWESHDTGSLLEWGQVRSAVQAAWMRGRHALVEHPSITSQARLEQGIGPLLEQHRSFLKQLTYLMLRADPPPSEFVSQVLERHKRMVAEFSEELQEVVDIPKTGLNRTWSLFKANISQAWMRLRVTVAGADAARVLQFCVAAEEGLLSRYQVLCKKNLSPEINSLLERQHHRLHMNYAKLVWVQRNWVDRV